MARIASQQASVDELQGQPLAEDAGIAAAAAVEPRWDLGICMGLWWALGPLKPQRMLAPIWTLTKMRAL